MEYFNQALKDDSFYFMPRKNPITIEEIKNKWLPSLKENISLVAELGGKVIGAITAFYDPLSSNYEHISERESGSLNSTANPSFNYKAIVKKLIDGMSNELKSQGKTATANIPIESPSIKAFEELGYIGKEIFLDRYKKSGLSGKATQYNLP